MTMTLQEVVRSVADDIKAARGVDVGLIRDGRLIKMKHDTFCFSDYHNRMRNVVEMRMIRNHRHWGKGYKSIYSYTYDTNDPAYPVNMIDDMFVDPKEEDRDYDIIKGCTTNWKIVTE